MAVHRTRPERSAPDGDHGARARSGAGDALDAYAERFAAAGWSVLVFDYRHLGASGGEPRQILDIGRQRADWHAALAFARTLPEVDVNRIALWGSSFGGGHVLRVASEDTRIAAIVAQCPFTDGPASLRARIRTGPLSVVALTVQAFSTRSGRGSARSRSCCRWRGRPGCPRSWPHPTPRRRFRTPARGTRLSRAPARC